MPLEAVIGQDPSQVGVTRENSMPYKSQAFALEPRWRLLPQRVHDRGHRGMFVRRDLDLDTRWL